MNVLRPVLIMENFTLLRPCSGFLYFLIFVLFKEHFRETADRGSVDGQDQSSCGAKRF